MNTKQLSAIATRVGRAFPTLASKGSLVFFRPIGHTIRGIVLDRSGDPRLFYVRVFIQPLCVPETGFFFNLGWRLGGGTHRWNADSPSIVEDLQQALVTEALPFLEPIQSPSDAAIAGMSLNHSLDGISQRAIAYAFARGGDVPRAVRTLDHYLALGKDDSRDWVQELASEASTLKQLLLSKPTAAARQLLEWEDKTAAALGLSQFR